MLETIVDDGGIVNAKDSARIFIEVENICAVSRHADEAVEGHGVVGFAGAQREIKPSDAASGGGIQSGDIGNPRPDAFINGAIKDAISHRGGTDSGNEFEII